MRVKRTRQIVLTIVGMAGIISILLTVGKRLHSRSLNKETASSTVGIHSIASDQVVSPSKEALAFVKDQDLEPPGPEVRELSEPASLLISRLREEYQGRDFAIQLRMLGAQCGRIGPEAVKELLLALPPGQSSIESMRQSMEALAAEDLPEMLSWIQKNLDTLGEKFHQECLTELVRAWGNRDHDEVIEHIIGENYMSSEDKYRLIVKTLPSRLLEDAEALVSFIHSIPDRQVRSLLESETRLWPGPLTHSLELVQTKP